MQRGMDGKGQKNAMTLSAGCAGVPWLLRSQTADVATSRRHALTQTHILEESILKTMASIDLGERQKG